MDVRIKIEQSRPPTGDPPSIDEAAAALSEIAFTAMAIAVARGLPMPPELPTIEDRGRFLRSLLPGYAPGACVTTHEVELSTVRV